MSHFDYVASFFDDCYYDYFLNYLPLKRPLASIRALVPARNTTPSSKLSHVDANAASKCQRGTQIATRWTSVVASAPHTSDLPTPASFKMSLG